jgi:hypothetical protein
MDRSRDLFAVASLVVFALCSYTCRAQTIPPGVGARQYGAKLTGKNNVQSSLGPEKAKSIKSAASSNELTKSLPELKNPTAGSLPAVVKQCFDALHDPKTRKNHGAAKTIAYRVVCSLDTEKYTSDQIADGLTFIDNIGEGDGYADAIKKTASPDTSHPAEVLVKAAVNATPHVENVDCDAVYNSDTKQFDYQASVFLPATRNLCGQAGVLAFFNVTKNATFGNTVSYLYNPNLGASQFSSDLITAVFPQGFQVVLAGTGTVPTGQSSSGTTTPPTSQTALDPVALAVQKIESGGDFNLRFSFPVLSTLPKSTVWSTYLQPSVGFVLGNTSTQSNSSGAQVQYSSSNQYVISLPFESYFATSSITGDNSNGLTTATLFADLRYGGNIVSPEYQKTIGIPNRIFQLGQASAGINFAGSFRIGVQYFFGGPKQAYVLANASGQTTNVNTSIKGFHMVLTYSPKKTN